MKLLHILAMKRHHVAISDDNWEKLLTLEAAFSKQTGLKQSWGDFFVQAAAYFVGGISDNRVDAKRLGRYIYGAYCPKCEELNMLLGKVVVWHVVCEKCGYEFVASRRC